MQQQSGLVWRSTKVLIGISDYCKLVTDHYHVTMQPGTLSINRFDDFPGVVALSDLSWRSQVRFPPMATILYEVNNF